VRLLFSPISWALPAFSFFYIFAKWREIKVYQHCVDNSVDNLRTVSQKVHKIGCVFVDRLFQLL